MNRGSVTFALVLATFLFVRGSAAQTFPAGFSKSGERVVPAPALERVSAEHPQAANPSYKVWWRGESSWSNVGAPGNVDVEASGITVQGYADVGCDSTGVNCRAIVHQSASAVRTIDPFDTSTCGWSRSRYWMRDAGQWSIYVDDSNFTMLVLQHADGSYYMPIPFTLSRSYDVTGAVQGVSAACDAYSYVAPAGLQDPWAQFPAGDPGPHELLPNPNGGFSIAKQYQNNWKPPATLRYAMGVESVPTCAGGPSPVPDNSNLVTHHELWLDSDYRYVPPDRQTMASVTVTCDGVPVVGAEVYISSEALPMGDHRHDDGQRPGGCINGHNLPKGQAVIVRTDDKGKATFTFQPGTNETCGTPRGISGYYRLTAKSVRFSGDSTIPLVQITIEVARADFAQAAPPLLCTPSNSSHPDVHFATQATIHKIGTIADLFDRIQKKHNAQLVSQGQSAWPVVLLPIGNMSLAHGGLFDRDENWRTPYTLHYNGTSVDFLPSCWPVLPAQGKWLSQLLKDLGAGFGQWVPDELSDSPPALALEVTNAAQSASSLLKPGSATPDLAVTTLLSGPSDRLVAAPGQTVTYTVGLENMNGTADAHNVILTATLPIGLDYVSASPVPSQTFAGGLTWDVGTVLSGTLPQLYDVVVQVNGSLAPGSVLTVTAAATTTDPEASLTNNQDNAGGLLIRALGPDLAVRSDLGSRALTVDRPVTFTMDVINLGTDLAPAASLTLTLPVSVTLIGSDPLTTTAAGGQAAWHLGAIAPGQFKTLTATLGFDPILVPSVSFDPDTNPPAVLTFTVRAGSAGIDINTANDAIHIAKPLQLVGPDVAAWLDGPVRLSAGQDVTYTANYGNNGNEIAPTTTLTLAIGSGFEVISAIPAPARTITDTNLGARLLGWDLGDVLVGSIGLVQVRVRGASVPVEGIPIWTTIQTTDFDIDPINNVASERVVPLPLQDRLFLPLVRR